MHFKIDGHHGLEIRGEIKGHHKGDKVKVKFKSDKTHRVAGKIVGKVDGTFVAKPGSSLKVKIIKFQVTKEDFKSVAREAFRKMKKQAKSQGLPTKHMRLKFKFDTN